MAAKANLESVFRVFRFTNWNFLLRLNCTVFLFLSLSLFFSLQMTRTRKMLSLFQLSRCRLKTPHLCYGMRRDTNTRTRTKIRCREHTWWWMERYCWGPGRRETPTHGLQWSCQIFHWVFLICFRLKMEKEQEKEKKKKKTSPPKSRRTRMEVESGPKLINTTAKEEGKECQPHGSSTNTQGDFPSYEKKKSIPAGSR